MADKNETTVAGLIRAVSDMEQALGEAASAAGVASILVEDHVAEGPRDGRNVLIDAVRAEALVWAVLHAQDLLKNVLSEWDAAAVLAAGIDLPVATSSGGVDQEAAAGEHAASFIDDAGSGQ